MTDQVEENNEKAKYLDVGQQFLLFSAMTGRHAKWAFDLHP